MNYFFFFSSRRRHTRCSRDWSSDVCSSDLLVLVEKAGHIVEKEELLEKVWPGVFDEEGNLARHIFNLRQVLGDRPDGRKYIETIPTRGYRFVAAVQEDPEPAAPPLVAAQRASD